MGIHNKWRETQTPQRNESKTIEKQRPVVNLVSPVAQATEMARSEIKREREMAKSKTFAPPGRRKNVYRSITEDNL